MSSDDGRAGGGVEWLGDGGGDEGGGDVGEELLSGGPGPRRWPRWVPFVGVLAIAGVIAGLLISQRDSNRSVAAPTDSAAPTSAQVSAPVIPQFSDLPTAAPVSVPPLTTPAPRLTARTSAPLGAADLGITAGYELFAYGPGVVERIQFAKDRLTATPVPAVLSTGPRFFLVGTHAALVRPMDSVPGYLVPDGGAAEPLNGALARGGMIYPGPTPGHAWVNGIRANSWVLVDFRGRATSTRITLPAGASPAGPDGGGYLVVDGSTGVYDVRPGTRTLITTGTLLASGPTGWLVRECVHGPVCDTVYVDRKNEARRTVHVSIDPSDTQGVIAPNGKIAVIPESKGGTATLHLIDLVTGTDTPLGLRLPWAGYGISQLAWSPDSRWLFVAGGRLRAVDAATGHVDVIAAGPPGLSFGQLAVRPAIGSA